MALVQHQVIHNRPNRQCRSLLNLLLYLDHIRVTGGLFAEVIEELECRSGEEKHTGLILLAP
jgi:hypothetical protein